MMSRETGTLKDGKLGLGSEVWEGLRQEALD